ncbi:HNH endonuclease, partial [bacterium]|nr:HNH endonuclease [bacterium]
MIIKPINYFHSFKNVKPQKQGIKTSENNFSNPFSFKGFACSKDGFAPRNIYAMPCASCGEKTIQTKQLDTYVRKIKDLKGADLVYELQQRSAYYRAIESRIIKNIIFEALTDKSKDLKDIIGILSSKYMTELVDAQVKVLDAIEKNSKNFKKETRDSLKNYVAEQKDLIVNPDYENEKYFRRQEFIEKLKGIIPAEEQGEEADFLVEIAEKIPASSNSESAFYASYSRKSNEDIARRLFSGALATTEHVTPASKGGANDTSNYIVMCADCNSRRSDMPYSEWIIKRPNFKTNFDKYLREVEVKIETGELGEEYETYPDEILETFSNELGEKVKREKKTPTAHVDIPQEEQEVDSEKQLESRISKLEKSVDARRKRLDELKIKSTQYEQDDTYLALKKLSSKEETLEGLRQTASRLKKESSDIKTQQEKLPQKKEQLEKTQKKAEELDRKCRQLSFEIARDSELGVRAGHVKEEETKCYAQIKSLNEEIKTAKTSIRLPDVIAAEILELQAEVENLDTLKLRLQALLNKKAETEKNQEASANLTEELKELDKEMAELTKAKATSRTSAEHLKQYAELRDKADKIRRMQSEDYIQKTRETKEHEETLLANIIRLNDDIMKNFHNISISDKKNVAKYQELSEKLSKMKTMFKKYQATAASSDNSSKYDFILAEALESIEAKIEEMNLNPEIKLLFMQDKRKALQARIKQEQA